MLESAKALETLRRVLTDKTILGHFSTEEFHSFYSIFKENPIITYCSRGEYSQNKAEIMDFNFKDDGKFVSFLDFLVYLINYAEEYKNRFGNPEKHRFLFHYYGSFGWDKKPDGRPYTPPVPRFTINFYGLQPSAYPVGNFEEDEEVLGYCKLIRRSMWIIFSYLSLPLSLPLLIDLFGSDFKHLIIKDNKEFYKTLSLRTETDPDILHMFLREDCLSYFSFNLNSCKYKIFFSYEPTKDETINIISNIELPKEIKESLLATNDLSRKTDKILFQTFKEFIETKPFNYPVNKVESCYVKHGLMKNTEERSELVLDDVKDNLFLFLENNTNSVGGIDVLIADLNGKLSSFQYDKTESFSTVYFRSNNSTINNFILTRLLFTEFIYRENIKEIQFLPRDLDEKEIVTSIDDISKKCDIEYHTLEAIANVYNHLGDNLNAEFNKCLFTGGFISYNLSLSFKFDPTRELHSLYIDKQSKSDMTVFIYSTNTSLVEVFKEYTKSKFSSVIKIEFKVNPKKE